MFTSATVSTLVAVLPALSTLTSNSTKVVRRHNRVRHFTTLKKLYENSPVTAAIAELLACKVPVKVCRGNVIFRPALNTDGSLNWSNTRNTSKTRKMAVVEVAL